jgi:hypothetical protein
VDSLNNSINASFAQDQSESEFLSLFADYQTKIEESAVELKAFQRPRNIRSAMALLRGLLIYATHNVALRGLAAASKALGIASMSDTALSKRLRKATTWLIEVMSLIFKSILEVETAQEKLYKGRNTRVFDGSIITQEGNGKRGGQIIKGKPVTSYRMHTSYNLIQQRIDEMTITDDRTGEGFRHYTLNKGDLCLADAGYGTTTNIVIAIESGADVIVRITPNHIRLYNKKRDQEDVYALLSQTKDELIDKRYYLEKDKSSKKEVRVIAQRLPAEKQEASQARARTRAKRKNQKIKPQTLEYCKWVILLTTVMDENAIEILRLYRLRWQVELLFKRMKGHFSQRILRACSRETAVSTLCLEIIAWLQSEREALKLAAQAKPHLNEDDYISIAMMAKVAYEVIRNIIGGNWARHVLNAPESLRLLKDHASSRGSVARTV